MAPPPEPPGWVKLLLDVHHSPRVAERVRAGGRDVIAAADVPELAVMSDEELLRSATADGRAVVTENASRLLQNSIAAMPLYCTHES